MGGIVHRNNALKDKMVASNVLMGLGNDSTDTVEKRIRDLEEGGGGGGGSVVRVLPLLDEGVHIADISVDGHVSELYAPEGGGGSGEVEDVTINGQSIVQDHVASIPVMTGATQQSNGAVGLVPAPSVNDRNKVLMGDGTWGSGGLVDDVLVDGTSVVNNKVANIDLTGKQDVLTEGDNVKIENDVISVPEMVGATSMESGKSGVVPQPLTSDKDKFLRGDGTWATPGGSGGGAVNDVQVNGVGVVDANGVAKINDMATTQDLLEKQNLLVAGDNILLTQLQDGTVRIDVGAVVARFG